MVATLLVDPLRVQPVKVQESTTQRGSFSANFHNGSGTSKTASKGNGVYYYRAKACHGSNCSGVSGWKKVIVAIKPGIPGAISTSPSSPTEGSNFNVSWGASSGSVSKYELRRGSSLIYSSGGTTKTNENVSAGSYAYKVKACKTVSTFTSCSGERTKTVSVGLQRSTISLTGNASVTEGGTLSFGISRTGGTSQSQSVSVSVINGSASTSDNDYSTPASSITFSPGQTSKTISVSTIGHL